MDLILIPRPKKAETDTKDQSSPKKRRGGGGSSKKKKKIIEEKIPMNEEEIYIEENSHSIPIEEEQTTRKVETVISGTHSIQIETNEIEISSKLINSQSISSLQLSSQDANQKLVSCENISSLQQNSQNTSLSLISEASQLEDSSSKLNEITNKGKKKRSNAGTSSSSRKAKSKKNNPKQVTEVIEEEVEEEDQDKDKEENKEEQPEKKEVIKKKRANTRKKPQKEVKEIDQKKEEELPQSATIEGCKVEGQVTPQVSQQKITVDNQKEDKSITEYRLKGRKTDCSFENIDIDQSIYLSNQGDAPEDLIILKNNLDDHSIINHTCNEVNNHGDNQDVALNVNVKDDSMMNIEQDISSKIQEKPVALQKEDQKTTQKNQNKSKDKATDHSKSVDASKQKKRGRKKQQSKEESNDAQKDNQEIVETKIDFGEGYNESDLFNQLKKKRGRKSKAELEEIQKQKESYQANHNNQIGFGGFADKSYEDLFLEEEIDENGNPIPSFYQKEKKNENTENSGGGFGNMYNDDYLFQLLNSPHDENQCEEEPYGDQKSKDDERAVLPPPPQIQQIDNFQSKNQIGSSEVKNPQNELWRLRLQDNKNSISNFDKLNQNLQNEEEIYMSDSNSEEHKGRDTFRQQIDKGLNDSNNGNNNSVKINVSYGLSSIQMEQQMQAKSAQEQQQARQQEQQNFKDKYNSNESYQNYELNRLSRRNEYYSKDQARNNQWNQDRQRSSNSRRYEEGNHNHSGNSSEINHANYNKNNSNSDSYPHQSHRKKEKTQFFFEVLAQDKALEEKRRQEERTARILQEKMQREASERMLLDPLALNPNSNNSFPQIGKYLIKNENVNESNSTIANIKNSSPLLFNDQILLPPFEENWRDCEMERQKPPIEEEINYFDAICDFPNQGDNQSQKILGQNHWESPNYDDFQIEEKKEIFGNDSYRSPSRNRNRHERSHKFHELQHQYMDKIYHKHSNQDDEERYSRSRKRRHREWRDGEIDLSFEGKSGNQDMKGFATESEDNYSTSKNHFRQEFEDRLGYRDYDRYPRNKYEQSWNRSPYCYDNQNNRSRDNISRERNSEAKQRYWMNDWLTRDHKNYKNEYNKGSSLRKEEALDDEEEDDCVKKSLSL